jgi:vanillate/3-O-methylgallate O-demethylase
MNQNSLAGRIAAAGSAYRMLYDSPYMPFKFPLEPEFSNWRDEQEAWRKSAVFMDMSFHMVNLALEGPDTYRLLSDFGINSFASFGPMQAKQYVACNSDGLYIGDAILTCEEENKVNLIGKPILPNWIRFQIETGKYDAKVVRVDRPAPTLSEQTLFRYQIQGPTAQSILEECNGGPIPPIGFFKMGKLRIGKHTITALNHRMSGAPGLEIWGPAIIGPEVKDVILRSGKKHQIREIGSRIFRVTAAESGWVSTAVPAIYTGEATKAYREWLPANSFEGNSSIGGSYQDGNLEKLYLTPAEVGYGFMTKFDHEFCGREALEKMAGRARREKVRVVWNTDDVVMIQKSIYGEGPRFKYMEMPVADYCTFLADEIRVDGKQIGFSFHPVYSINERAWISLAVVDAEFARSKQQGIVTWGEPAGGSKKPTVEAHQQCSVRILIEPNAVRRN